MTDVAVFTLGCKVNQAESDELKAGLEDAGYRVTSDAAAADLCVVNTCTVTSESDRKCRKLIRALGRRGASRIVVAGCYAEVNPADVEGLPGVIRTIPNSRKDGWLEEIISLLPAPGDSGPGSWRRRARVFVKVQDGCERGCSYCIVPRARGRERSWPRDSVVEAVGNALKAGAKEIVLCGINLGRYACGDTDLAALVREVLASGGGFRVRLSSIELEDLRLEWLRDWAVEGRVCPHLHLPLQSGDADILRDMGRGYGPSEYVTAAQALRREWPAAALTTEVIVGYPGEDEASFRRTVKVLKKVEPARVHVFRFSPRPGTGAWGRAGAAAPGEAEERSRELLQLAEALRLRYIEGRRGQMRGLLVENVSRADGKVFASGTTEDYIKGKAYGLEDGTAAGDILDAEICGVEGGMALMRAVRGRSR